MKNSGIRIIRSSLIPFNDGSGYDATHSYMQGYSLDLTRKTAALIRQSRKGADEDNPESRLRQEGLEDVAVEIRGDHDPLMVVGFDEGSGVSGQKKIYDRPKFLELWEAILHNIVGSVFVVREDRLFRHRFVTQPSQFAEECAKRGVLVIVAGYRCYDFNNKRDYDDFLRKMQEAYGYIDTHIRYMVQMRQQKRLRGEWVGGILIAPYALDRQALQQARERRKAIKEFGGSQEDELLIARASRPVIYEGWHDRAVDLFEKFKLFNFSPARFGRYVEELPYIFPLPSAEDLQRYMFSVRMQLVPGRGYTFGASHRMPYWLTNLMHLGYAPVGEDENGQRLYIENAFDPAIPQELFAECYEAITGFTVDGEPSTVRQNHSRFVRKSHADEKNDLLTQCFTSPDPSLPMTVQARYDVRTVLCYYGCLRRQGRLSAWESAVLWTLPTATLDRAVVERLTELAEHDRALADRVEAYYTELTKNRTAERDAIVKDITGLEELIAHYDRLITNPAQSLTTSQEKRYLQQQANAERDLEKAQSALTRYERAHPQEFLPAFYRILGQAPGEFWNLDIDRQRRMLYMLIDDIQVTNISPHIYKLLLKWKEPVAERWDCALIYKRQAVRTDKLGELEWTDAEDELLKSLWPEADKMGIYRSLPTKSGVAITARANRLGVHRALQPSTALYRSLCHDDWARSCAALEVPLDSAEGRQLLEQLNYFAKTTGIQERAAVWWVLPVVQMNDLDGDLSS